MTHEQFPTSNNDKFRDHDDSMDDPFAYLRGPAMPFEGDGNEERDLAYGEELKEVSDHQPEDNTEESKAA